jgi:arylsulfatase A-like enzyme
VGKSALTALAIRLPGSPHAGTTCTRPVSAIDFFTTRVDYCGLKAPEHTLEGLSLRPLLENPGAAWSRPAITS